MSILADILAVKADEVAERKQRRPTAEILRGLAPSERSLARALSDPRRGFILESKRASPSGGLIRTDYDPAGIARSYAPYADAVSVLTDERFFGGSPEHLRAVRAELSQPVLLKDFVLEPYQVYEARAWGADAVLLMLSVLDDEGFGACRRAAVEYGMDVLAEAHTRGEVRRALDLGAGIVGINNRDLRTLQVDLAVCEELAPLVPGDRLVVCESGIRGRRDLRRLAPHADAFLVGSSLMAEDDLESALRGLLFGPVKVCGLTSNEDARIARERGASWGGLIFAPESPRRVGEAAAVEIKSGVPLNWTGVFVNEDPDTVAELAARLELAAVQLHGDEDVEYVSRLRPLLPASCETWKAVRVKDSLPSLAETGADRLLLDAWTAGARGGTGGTFDWSLLEGCDEKDRVILAGGLEPGNLAAADALGCWALDVNSGVESAPGRKDRGLLEQAFAALRGGGRRSDA